MNRKSFSNLAKVKGARTPSGHLGSARMQGTGSPNVASPNHIPTGKGTRPSLVGGAKTRQGSTRTGG